MLKSEADRHHGVGRSWESHPQTALSESPIMITDILKLPLVYPMFQYLGGFFDARLKAIGSYLPIKSGQKVVDIGCGPGFIVEHLPRGISYLGFDTDASYIAYAMGRFGDKGRFFLPDFRRTNRPLSCAGGYCNDEWGSSSHER